MARLDGRKALLIEILDQAFAARSWNGTNLRGVLRGVTPELALWRPGPGRPRIWDYLLHCAWWKHMVRRRLSAVPIEEFPRSPANFPAVPKRPTAVALRADIRLLEAEQRALRALVERMPAGHLEKRAPKGRWRHVEQIHGVAAHDCYHTGQIQLIKRLRATATKS
jgi:hypothetical protein